MGDSFLEINWITPFLIIFNICSSNINYSTKSEMVLTLNILYILWRYRIWLIWSYSLYDDIIYIACKRHCIVCVTHSQASVSLIKSLSKVVNIAQMKQKDHNFFSAYLLTVAASEDRIWIFIHSQRVIISIIVITVILFLCVQNRISWMKY